MAVCLDCRDNKLVLVDINICWNWPARCKDDRMTSFLMTATPHISACRAILLLAIRILALCLPDTRGQMTYTTVQYAVREASKKAARDGSPEVLEGRDDVGPCGEGI